MAYEGDRTLTVVQLNSSQGYSEIPHLMKALCVIMQEMTFLAPFILIHFCPFYPLSRHTLKLSTASLSRPARLASSNEDFAILRVPLDTSLALPATL